MRTSVLMLFLGYLAVDGDEFLGSEELENLGLCVAMRVCEEERLA